MFIFKRCFTLCCRRNCMISHDESSYMTMKSSGFSGLAPTFSLLAHFAAFLILTFVWTTWEAHHYENFNFFYPWSPTRFYQLNSRTATKHCTNLQWPSNAHGVLAVADVVLIEYKKTWLKKELFRAHRRRQMHTVPKLSFCFYRYLISVEKEKRKKKRPHGW